MKYNAVRDNDALRSENDTLKQKLRAYEHQNQHVQWQIEALSRQENEDAASFLAGNVPDYEEDEELSDASID